MYQKLSIVGPYYTLFSLVPVLNFQDCEMEEFLVLNFESEPWTMVLWFPSISFDRATAVHVHKH